MNNFRRRVEGEIKLVSTTYTISSVKNKNIVIVNPNQQFTIYYQDLYNEYRINRGVSSYTQNPYICITCDIVFTKTETYSNGSVKTSTINASFTTTGAGSSYGAIPDYSVRDNGDILAWTSLSSTHLPSSISSLEDRNKCGIIIHVESTSFIINTSSLVGAVGSGSFLVKISGNPFYISNYNARYSFGVVNTMLTKTSDTTFSEVLST